METEAPSGLWTEVDRSQQLSVDHNHTYTNTNIQKIYEDLVDFFTFHYIHPDFSVDIYPSPGHPTPEPPSIRGLKRRDGGCENVFLLVIVHGVFGVIRLSCFYYDVLVSATEASAQVLLVRLVFVSVGAENFSFSSFVSKHLDQRCCADRPQSDCGENRTQRKHFVITSLNIIFCYIHEWINKYI